VLVGHSAGGHLALLAAKRTQLPVIAIAAVCDPPTWENDGVAAFFEGAAPAEGSPLAQLPLAGPCVLIHGTEDSVVPIEQSERFADAARATLIRLDGAGHFEPVDPQSPESATVVRAIQDIL
jgi:pimeloyl-ACP methyl ester carboxylesterase